MLHQCGLLPLGEKYATYVIYLSDKTLYLLLDQALSSGEMMLLLSSLVLCVIRVKTVFPSTS